MSSKSKKEITMQPIGWIESERKSIEDDNWGNVISTIKLDSLFLAEDATKGLEEFSHLVVVFYMHKVSEEKIQTGARHPRNQKDWPKVGIFAQRAKGRPNRIGVSTCPIIKVDGLNITVQGLDAIDQTPVLDLKPYFTEFSPKEKNKQPLWSSELMKNYF